MLTLDNELKALRTVFNRDTEYAPITEAQLQALNSLINKGLEDSRLRLPVLRLITGIDRLTSSRQLTFWTAHTLIEELKDAQEKCWDLSIEGEQLLELCERRVEVQAILPEKRSHSKRNVAPVPNM